MVLFHLSLLLLTTFAHLCVCMFIAKFVCLVFLPLPVGTLYRLLNEQNRNVGRKLVFTTGLMFTLPIITYFIVNYIVTTYYKDTIQNPDNYSGGAAILMTNIIVGGYCYMAYYEDNNEIIEPPRVGKFKTRTD